MRSATRTAAGAAAATLALTACALTACDPGGPASNGAEKQTSTQVSAAASAALRGAASVHLAGTAKDATGTTTIDLRFQGRNVTGFLQQRDQRIDITRVGTVTYIRAASVFYRLEGNSAAAARAGGRWVRTTPAQARQFDDVTLDSLGTQFFSDGAPKPGVTATTLNGAKAVTFVSQDSTRVWVADTGPIRPLRAEKTGTGGSVVTFTEYGANFAITAPAGAIDAATLR